jgi:DGQHR domain-containing protein
MVRTLKLPALEIQQGKNRKLYSFAVDGKHLHDFCTVSRVSRQEGEMNGYQRPEVVSHITQIRDYLESEEAILPNAIVVAVDSRVSFRHSGRISDDRIAGTIEIPLDNDNPVGWIVDGQQRAAALRDADVENFNVCVVAFVCDGVRQQRQQFILVNSTKPLPSGLIHELLPLTDGVLPARWRKKKYPSELLQRLNHDDDSPFKSLIRTPTNPEGVIADNSVLKMLQNSITDGALFYSDDVVEHLSLLKNFWGAVADVFRDAWGMNPRKSRLMHGVGIVSMGFIMDAILAIQRQPAKFSTQQFTLELKTLQSVCRWTQGAWEFAESDHVSWNALQNVDRDIQRLTNYLVRRYRDTFSRI